MPSSAPAEPILARARTAQITAARGRLCVTIGEIGGHPPGPRPGQADACRPRPGLTGQLQRRRRQRCKLRGGPARPGPGHSASWCADRRGKRPLGRPAAGLLHPARRCRARRGPSDQRAPNGKAPQSSHQVTATHPTDVNPSASDHSRAPKRSGPVVAPPRGGNRPDHSIRRAAGSGSASARRFAPHRTRPRWSCALGVLRSRGLRPMKGITEVDVFRLERRGGTTLVREEE
jgi:hypothetical protein